MIRNHNVYIWTWGPLFIIDTTSRWGGSNEYLTKFGKVFSKRYLISIKIRAHLICANFKVVCLNLDTHQTALTMYQIEFSLILMGPSRLRREKCSLENNTLWLGLSMDTIQVRWRHFHIYTYIKSVLVFYFYLLRKWVIKLITIINI